MVTVSTLGTQWQSPGNGDWDTSSCLCSFVQKFNEMGNVLVVFNVTKDEMAVNLSVDVLGMFPNVFPGYEG